MNFNKIIGEYFIQRNGKPTIFKLCKNISKTMKENKMGYKKTIFYIKMILNK